MRHPARQLGRTVLVFDSVLCPVTSGSKESSAEEVAAVMLNLRSGKEGDAFDGARGRAVLLVPVLFLPSRVRKRPLQRNSWRRQSGAQFFRVSRRSLGRHALGGLPVCCLQLSRTFPLRVDALASSFLGSSVQAFRLCVVTGDRSLKCGKRTHK